MLIIYTDQNEAIDTDVADGDIGNKRLKQFLETCKGSVNYVQADRAELDYAWRLLGRVGEPPGSMHHFFGDTAKEIVFNCL